MAGDHQVMREAIASEYGFSLYRQYAEKEVCGFLQKDISTLKRWRAKGLIEFIKMGPKHIRYFGYHVADMLIHGVSETDECQNTPREASKVPMKKPILKEPSAFDLAGHLLGKGTK